VQQGRFDKLNASKHEDYMTIEEDMAVEWDRNNPKTYALSSPTIKRFVDISIAAGARRHPDFLNQYRDTCPPGTDLLAHVRDVHTLRMDNGTAIRTRIEFGLEQGVNIANPTESFTPELKALLPVRGR
jgi:hypothetical protein